MKVEFTSSEINLLNHANNALDIFVNKDKVNKLTEVYTEDVKTRITMINISMSMLKVERGLLESKLT